MLRKAFQSTRTILFSHSFKFSGGHNQHNLHPDEKVEINDFNPEGLRELRGLEGVAKLSDSKKVYLPYHNTFRKTFALYNIFRYLPTWFIKWLPKFVADPKIAIASDALYFPKTSENSIPVYQSLANGAPLRDLIKIFLLLTPVPLLISAYPWIGLLTYAIYFQIMRETYFRLIKGFVIRLELIPQTEEIAIQQINIFGNISTRRIKISDLQHTKSLIQVDSIFDRSVRSYINKYMTFKVKSTGEELFFDKNGVWYDEGLNHELLN